MVRSQILYGCGEIRARREEGRERAKDAQGVCAAGALVLGPDGLELERGVLRDDLLDRARVRLVKVGERLCRTSRKGVRRRLEERRELMRRRRKRERKGEDEPVPGGEHISSMNSLSFKHMPERTSRLDDVTPPAGRTREGGSQLAERVGEEVEGGPSDAPLLADASRMTTTPFFSS